MFHYEYESRALPSRSEGRSPSMPAAAWVRVGPNVSRVSPSVERARRPLPPRPLDRIPTKPTVPLRVWVVASASCLAVSAALVVATLALTRWTTAEYTQVYSPGYSSHAIRSGDDDRILEKSRELKNCIKESVFAKHSQEPDAATEKINDLAILEKLSLFNNIVANRDRHKDLLSKPQIHPVHDHTDHVDRKIEKKDKAKLPDTLKSIHFKTIPIHEVNKNIKEFKLPEFKPLLPMAKDLKLPESYLTNLNNKDYEEYYNDVNLYDDYMESNSMTSYLIEKVQELHDWITNDPDFDTKNNGTSKGDTKTDFSQILKALNESLLEGNVSIIMNKLKDIYLGDNYTNGNTSRRVILTNSTDLVSLGILTLDAMLLHNIQAMAWEGQEGARSKMLKDPNVFAFNALFMEPGKVEAKQTEIQNTSPGRVRDGSGFFERALEGVMSTARAALHLGRAYKNARNIITQLSSRDAAAGPPPSLARHADNAHALHHLQTFSDSDSQSPSANASAINPAPFSELDCVWLLYCRNLVVTARLPPPYGTMARINGMGLRLVSGAVSPERALDVLLHEALAGWTPLDCNTMLPKCSNADAASIVLKGILQPQKKTNNRGR